MIEYKKKWASILKSGEALSLNLCPNIFFDSTSSQVVNCLTVQI
jgi:hypothetical protein